MKTTESDRHPDVLHGFTRADLLVSVATAGLLTLVQVGAVGSLKSTGDATRCLDHLRNLTQAWQQYGLDHGHLPPNPDDGNTTPGKNWVGGCAGPGQSYEFDADILEDPVRSLLLPYLGEAGVSVFHCPADPRVGAYQGEKPELIGATVPSARSYSMNGAVGTNPYRTPLQPVDGPWLDDKHLHHYGRTWRTYGGFGDMVDPSPANLAVILDEDEDSLNDGHFAFGMEWEEWIDWVATRHGMRGGISFADGHAIMQDWKDPRTAVPNGNTTRRIVPDSVDYQWLRRHISAPIQFERSILVPPTPAIGQNEIRLVWPVQDAAPRHVEFSEDLKRWQPLDGELQVKGGQAVASDPAPMSGRRRFYRLVAE